MGQFIWSGPLAPSFIVNAKKWRPLSCLPRSREFSGTGIDGYQAFGRIAAVARNVPDPRARAGWRRWGSPRCKGLPSVGRGTQSRSPWWQSQMARRPHTARVRSSRRLKNRAASEQRSRQPPVPLKFRGTGDPCSKHRKRRASSPHAARRTDPLHWIEMNFLYCQRRRGQPGRADQGRRFNSRPPATGS